MPKFTSLKPPTSGTAISRRDGQLVVPDEPRTSCTVARIGGGNGLNSIPQEAWLELDLRSEDQRELLQLDRAVEAILIDAAEQENRRRTPGTAPIHMDRQLLGDRPCGATPWTHPLVQTAVAATKAIGKTHQLAIASTDANIPIALGIPAIALGAGGKAGDTHLSSEWYENEEGALGLVRALLVVAATELSQRAILVAIRRGEIRNDCTTTLFMRPGITIPPPRFILSYPALATVAASSMKGL